MKDQDKAQEFLNKFSPKPLSKEVQKKIMAAAKERYERSLVISPFSRTVLVISVVLIIFVLFSDNMIKNRENDFFSSVLNGAQAAEKRQNDEIQEVINEFFNIDNSDYLRQKLLRHYKPKKRSAGLTGYQNILDLLKE